MVMVRHRVGGLHDWYTEAMYCVKLTFLMCVMHALTFSIFTAIKLLALFIVFIHHIFHEFLRATPSANLTSRWLWVLVLMAFLQPFSATPANDEISSQEAMMHLGWLLMLGLIALFWDWMSSPRPINSPPKADKNQNQKRGRKYRKPKTSQFTCFAPMSPARKVKKARHTSSRKQYRTRATWWMPPSGSRGLDTRVRNSLALCYGRCCS